MAPDQGQTTGHALPDSQGVLIQPAEDYTEAKPLSFKGLKEPAGGAPATAERGTEKREETGRALESEAVADEEARPAKRPRYGEAGPLSRACADSPLSTASVRA